MINKIISKYLYFTGFYFQPCWNAVWRTSGDRSWGRRWRRQGSEVPLHRSRSRRRFPVTRQPRGLRLGSRWPRRHHHAVAEPDGRGGTSAHGEGEYTNSYSQDQQRTNGEKSVLFRFWPGLESANVASLNNNYAVSDQLILFNH